MTQHDRIDVRDAAAPTDGYCRRAEMISHPR
jgi:hypothetical protein